MALRKITGQNSIAGRVAYELPGMQNTCTNTCSLTRNARCNKIGSKFGALTLVRRSPEAVL